MVEGVLLQSGAKEASQGSHRLHGDVSVQVLESPCCFGARVQGERQGTSEPQVLRSLKKSFQRAAEADLDLKALLLSDAAQLHGLGLLSLLLCLDGSCSSESQRISKDFIEFH